MSGTLVGPTGVSKQAAESEALGVPIVLFTNAWAMGGMEQNILDLGCILARRGHRVAAICYDAPAIAPLRDGLRSGGVDVYVLGGDASPVGRLRRFRQLLDVFRRYRGCVLHMVEGWPAGDGLVILAAQLAGAKLVRTEQQGPVLPVSSRLRLATRLKDRFTAHVVCVSAANSREYVRHVGRDEKKLVVIPNAIDPTTFAGTGGGALLRRELGFAKDVPVVGLVARLSEERKGANYFIDMAARVAEQAPNVRFVVVGDGVLRPQLEEQAKRFGVSDRIFFLGERSDVPALLAAMTVFVQPSLAEGASYVLLEAMAAGVPVVATPVGSAPEIIRDAENGLLVPVRDPVSLAGAVLRLLGDEPLRRRMSSTASALVRERYSVEAMVDHYVALYRDLLGG